jgi:hypothetical protein
MVFSLGRVPAKAKADSIRKSPSENKVFIESTGLSGETISEALAMNLKVTYLRG